MAIQNCPLQPLHNQPFLGSSSAELLRANVPVYLQGMAWDTVGPGPAPYPPIHALTFHKPETHPWITWPWVPNVATPQWHHISGSHPRPNESPGMDPGRCMFNKFPRSIPIQATSCQECDNQGRHQKQMGGLHKALAPAEIRPQSSWWLKCAWWMGAQG